LDPAPGFGCRISSSIHHRLDRIRLGNSALRSEANDCLRQSSTTGICPKAFFPETARKSEHRKKSIPNKPLC
jgi:hypothetical protein